MGVEAVLEGINAAMATSGWGNMAVSDAMNNWLKCFRRSGHDASRWSGVVLYAAESQHAGRRGGGACSRCPLSRNTRHVRHDLREITSLADLPRFRTADAVELAFWWHCAPCDHEGSVEAATKYFVLGAMASGFLLYGMSMLLRRHGPAGHR